MRLTTDVYVQCDAPGCRNAVPQYVGEPRQDKCEEHRSQEIQQQRSNREHANSKRDRRRREDEG